MPPSTIFQNWLNLAAQLAAVFFKSCILHCTEWFHICSNELPNHHSDFIHPSLKLDIVLKFSPFHLDIFKINIKLLCQRREGVALMKF